MTCSKTALLAAAACLFGSPALAGWGTAIDRGTILSANGIVPVPGQYGVPYRGGNSRDQTDWAITALDSSSNPRPVIDGSDVTPAGYSGGGAYMTGYYQTTAGFVTASGGVLHAAYWVSGAFTDLHPAGFNSSVAEGVGGSGNVVGTATDTTGFYHPWLFVDHFEALPGQELPIPPGGFYSAAATSIAQGLSLYVGGYAVANGEVHPFVWSETNSTTYTPTDMLPLISGSTAGIAAAGTWDCLCTDGALPEFAGSVMTASSGGNWHAALWIPFAGGTGVGYDLHPLNTKYSASSIYAIRLLNKNVVYETGLAIAGHGRRARWHAMVWKGSASTATDLNRKLPVGQFSNSVATGIDELGNVEGSALDNSGVWHDVYWPKL
jgi:hypothetical protein